MSRRWRNPRGRRGEFFEVPKPVVAPQAQPMPLRLARARLRSGAVRRRRFTSVPLTVAIPAAPSFIPPFVRQTGGVPPRARRGEFASYPIQAAPLLPAFRRRRVGMLAPREGRFLTVPLPIVTPQPPPLAPQVVREAVRRAALRRGRSFSPPWPSQGTPPPPPWVPPTTGGGRRWLPRHRRGTFTGCPAVQGPSLPTSVRRRLGLPTRRGQFGFCPSTASFPAPAGRRRVTPPGLRRGALFEPSWPQAVPPPPPLWVPPPTTGRRGRAPMPRGRIVFPLEAQTQPEPTRGTLAAGFRRGPGVAAADRRGPSMAYQPRRGPGMEGG